MIALAHDLIERRREVRGPRTVEPSGGADLEEVARLLCRDLHVSFYYSMTSSAFFSTSGGIVMPSACATRLLTNTCVLVTGANGIFAGFSPRITRAASPAA